jgi:hypothetical protein
VQGHNSKGIWQCTAPVGNGSEFLIVLRFDYRHREFLAVYCRAIGSRRGRKLGEAKSLTEAIALAQADKRAQ